MLTPSTLSKEEPKLHKELIRFGKIVGQLKKIARKGWVSWAGVKNPESVADHIFRCAILAMCLSDLRGLNTEKIVRMMLLHDLHEALIGDYDYFDRKRIGQTKIKRNQRQAIKNIFSDLPKTINEKYRLLAEEYHRQESKEAKFVRQIDQIEMMMQALEYEEEGYDKRKLQPFWDDVQEKLQNPDLKKIFELLKKERGK